MDVSYIIHPLKFGLQVKEHFSGSHTDRLFYRKVRRHYFLNFVNPTFEQI